MTVCAVDRGAFVGAICDLFEVEETKLVDVVGGAVEVGLSFILAPGVPVRADPVGPRLPRVFSMAVSPMLDMKFIPALKGLDPGTLQERMKLEKSGRICTVKL